MSTMVLSGAGGEIAKGSLGYRPATFGRRRSASLGNSSSSIDLNKNGGHQSFMKDWRYARDPDHRNGRLEARRQSRIDTIAQKHGFHRGSAQLTESRSHGTLVRRPLCHNHDFFDGHEHEHRHAFGDVQEKRCREIFKDLDPHGRTTLNIAQIECSFAMMRINIDVQTFQAYVDTVLPLVGDPHGLHVDGFVEFHRRVWNNQPLAVRRSGHGQLAHAKIKTTIPKDNAIVPSSTANGKPKNSLRGHPTQTDKRHGPRMHASSHTGLHEIKSSNSMARRAFDKYDLDHCGFVDACLLPDVFADLGLDHGQPGDPEEVQAFLDQHFCHGDSGKRVSFHDFVQYQNKYISSIETLKGLDVGSKYRKSTQCDH